MFKSVIISIIAVLVMATSLFAQVDSVKFGGYIMTQAPHDSVKSFTNRWAVSKLTLHVDSIRGEFQYDLASNTVIAAQGCVPKSIFDGEATLYVGATFTAAGQITPSPNELNGKLWFPVHNSYTFIGNGIGVGYNRGALSLYAVRTNEFSAALTFHGIELLWQEDFAKTAGFTTPKVNIRHTFQVNAYGGKTWYNGGREDQLSGIVNLDYKSFRLFYAVNDGEVHNRALGVRLDATKHIRVKALRAFTPDGNVDFAEVGFSF
ncbi:MAG: hypothetical protein WCV85_04255 [Patescibacteria group bacterium]|jgi:hypothetical protein